MRASFACLVPGPSRFGSRRRSPNLPGWTGSSVPCWWPLHLGRPQRGHHAAWPPPHPGPRGSGEIVAVGEGVKTSRWGGRGSPGDPGLAHRPLPAGGPTSTAAASSPGRSSPTLRTASLAEYALIRTWMPAPPDPRGVSWEGAVMAPTCSTPASAGPAGPTSSLGTRWWVMGGGPGGPRWPSPGRLRGWANPSHRQPKGGGTGPVLRRHRRAQL